MNVLQTLHGILDVLPPLILKVEIDVDGASKAFEDGFILATDVADLSGLERCSFQESSLAGGQCH